MMSDFECLTNCSMIDPETCTILQSGKQYQEALYDEDGCFEPERYFRENNSINVYIQVSRIFSILIIVLGGAGFVGNLISILIFSRPDMRNCFGQILISLNFFDSLHIGFSILESLRNNFESSYPDLLLHIFPFFHYPMYRMSMCASIFLLIGTGVERYLAVCRPHHYHTVQNQTFRALYYILPSTIAAILINIPRFFDIEIANLCLDFTDCGCEKIER
ncbi:FMRFamide receptor [Eurytemora carolleeae]|uniref:FMRFamide receptor n=1 Tax=Eurytemora carolleeae TaxID=1294199 RepID=UPI000C75B85E|nr:FMRFamide receptor [Eurytemora carolleeae]|eukprot:XP_023327385.1 FMRFamide receptor-like [Eurytemora affinis]